MTWRPYPLKRRVPSMVLSRLKSSNGSQCCRRSRNAWKWSCKCKESGFISNRFLQTSRITRISSSSEISISLAPCLSILETTWTDSTKTKMRRSACASRDFNRTWWKWAKSSMKSRRHYCSCSSSKGKILEDSFLSVTMICSSCSEMQRTLTLLTNT